MNHADIEQAHPGQPHLPRPIVDLCDFVQANGYPISGCFELSSIGMDDLKLWFRGDSASYEQFLPFGRGASGDVYALWLADGRPTGLAPVVMFGSEGQLEVLSTNAEQFCRLLCLGYSEIGLDDPASEPEDFQETEPLRRFMVKRYGFQIPETAGPIIAAAAAAYPTFGSWVESRILTIEQMEKT